jgi:hypothetical protein
VPQHFAWDKDDVDALKRIMAPKEDPDKLSPHRRVHSRMIPRDHRRVPTDELVQRFGSDHPVVENLIETDATCRRVAPDREPFVQVYERPNGSLYIWIHPDNAASLRKLRDADRR